MPDAPEQRPFRFYDNREKYLLFTTTCSEKQETARRIGLEFPLLHPAPPAFTMFQAGSGEGTLLNMVLRQMHYRWPNVPILVVIKEDNPEFIRMAIRNLADRFREHPALVLIFTNLRYQDADWRALQNPEVQEQLKWREVSLGGTSSHGFAAQIAKEMGFVSEAWRAEGTEPVKPDREHTAALVLYRADQKFALDRVIPKRDGGQHLYDLILASQPYRSRLSAESKVRSLLAPLTRALAPGGRMLAIQSAGGDPGLEIVREVWPGEEPFATPRTQLLEVLRDCLTDERDDLDFIDPEGDAAEFVFRLQLNPDELDSAIGTSTLLAAWNAAAYVAQIEDERLNEAMSHEGYLKATRKVLRKHDGLWFNNECLVVARRATG